MKGLITVILFFMLILVCTKNEHFSAAIAVAAPTCAVEYDSAIPNHAANADAIIPLNRDRGLADMEFSDAHTLAHRVSTSAERLYRFSSIETSQFIKALLRRMATRMAILANNSPHIETSGIHRGEDVCEHYVYGMRHILI